MDLFNWAIGIQTDSFLCINSNKSFNLDYVVPPPNLQYSIFIDFYPITFMNVYIREGDIFILSGVFLISEIIFK